MPDTAMKGYAKLKIQEVLFNSRFGQFSNLQQQQYHGARDSPSFSRQQSASEEFNLENDTDVMSGINSALVPSDFYWRIFLTV